jgi:nitrate reductase assembly molybdenum cofactor insertion protein NarJ
VQKEIKKRLLRQVFDEAMELDDLKEKIHALKEIVADWASVDAVQAKVLYCQTYRVVEKTAMCEFDVQKAVRGQRFLHSP